MNMYCAEDVLIMNLYCAKDVIIMNLYCTKAVIIRQGWKDLTRTNANVDILLTVRNISSTSLYTNQSHQKYYL